VLNPGLYWLPLRLGSESAAVVLVREGAAARGPIDVVPDFTAGDKERLRELEREQTEEGLEG
jgi:hypothetical protein